MYVWRREDILSLWAGVYFIQHVVSIKLLGIRQHYLKAFFFLQNFKENTQNLNGTYMKIENLN